MIRTYCDYCGEDMQNVGNRNVVDHSRPPTFAIHPKAYIKVELRALVNGANSGHLCLPCARRIVAEGDTYA